MAQLLLLCLTEDEAAAQSLAATFERAGLTVDGCDGTEAEIARAGAVLVLWTPGAARSPGMRAAAHRVHRSNKGVFAVYSHVREAPPAGARCFDISAWSGDPDDPAIDDLFQAVDTLITRSRGGGAAPQQPRAPEPMGAAPGGWDEGALASAQKGAVAKSAAPSTSARIPAPPSKATVRAGPVRQIEPNMPPPVDLEEAAYWRAIRESNNIADFITFLQKYGETSMFAEVARMRMDQLKGGAGIAPAAGVADPAILDDFADDFDPPSVRRGPAAPPRGPRGNANARGAAAPRPSKAAKGKSGGPNFVLYGAIAVIVVAGCVGWFVMTGGFPEQTPQAPREVAEIDTAKVPTDPAPDEPVRAGPVEEAGAPAPIKSETVAEQPKPNKSQPPPQTAEAAPPPRQPPIKSDYGLGADPTRVTKPIPKPAGAAPPAGGGASQPASGGSQVAATPNVQPPLAAPPPALASGPGAGTSVSGRIRWERSYSAADLARLYPPRAERRSASGTVILGCTVQRDLSAECRVVRESPSNLGFGQAAVRASRLMRASATTTDGANAAGVYTTLIVAFSPPPS